MKVKTFLATIACVLAGGLSLANNAMAVTCPAGTIRAGQTVPTYAECNVEEVTGDDALVPTVTRILNVIVGIVGVVAVAMIIIGGVFFATSQGETAKTTRARNTILYGVVGLVIALLAFAIVNFVLTAIFPATPAGP